MATDLQKMEVGSGINGIANLLGQLNPLFGTGKATNTTSYTADPNALAQSDQILAKIFNDMNPDAIDAMVGNILERAKQTFGPATISPNAAGMRSYSDTVLQQMRNEAMARATGEAAGAKLEALNKANSTAANLVNARMQATRGSTGTTVTAASPLGKAAGAAGLAALLYNQVNKKKKTPGNEEAKGAAEGIVGSDYASGLTYDFESGTQAAAEGQIDLSAFGDTPSLSRSIAGAEGGEAIMNMSQIGDPANLVKGENTFTADAALGGISASDVLITDTRGIEEILTSQGLTVGSAMPPASGGMMPPAPMDPNTIINGDPGVPWDEGAASFGFGDAGLGPVAAINAISGGDLSAGATEIGGGGVETVIEMITAPFSGGGGGSGVVCTESLRQGLMTPEFAKREQAVAHKILSARTLRGYHWIALPIVTRMQKDKEFAQRMANWAHAYGHWILGEQKTIRGAIIKFLAVPVAWLAGWIAPPLTFPQMYKDLQSKGA